jgi:hypothetical protein
VHTFLNSKFRLNSHRSLEFYKDNLVCFLELGRIYYVLFVYYNANPLTSVFSQWRVVGISMISFYNQLESHYII